MDGPSHFAHPQSAAGGGGGGRSRNRKVSAEVDEGTWMCNDQRVVTAQTTPPPANASFLEVNGYKAYHWTSLLKPVSESM